MNHSAYIKARMSFASKQMRKNFMANMTVMVVPTTACNLHCSYCYARKSTDKSVVDMDKLGNTLKSLSVANLIVYGGEPLLVKGLPKVLRSACPTATMTFVSGLGLDLPTLLDRVGDVARHKGNFTFSIDPPADKGKEYHRGLEYETAVKYVHTIVKEFPRLNFGIRATITDECWDYARIRDDINPLFLSTELCHSGVHLDTLGKLKNVLEDDVQKIVAGKLNPMTTDLRNIIAALANPRSVYFGCCGDFYNRLSFGPDMKISVCNEIHTMPKECGSFLRFTNCSEFASKILAMLAGNLVCQKCAVYPFCGGGCPLNPRGKCGYENAKIQAALKVLMRSGNAIPNRAYDCSETPISEQEIVQAIQARPELKSLFCCNS